MYTREEIREKVAPKVCYLRGVKTLDTFEGLIAAERYIHKHFKKPLEKYVSFNEKSYEQPKGKTFESGYTYEFDETDIDAYEGAAKMLTARENVYPFVEEPASLENLELSMHAKTLYKISQGLKLRSYEEDFLMDNSDFIRCGILKLGGWIFDFRSFLETFWVKTDCGDINEYRALSEKLLKKYLRKCEECKAVKIVKI